MLHATSRTASFIQALETWEGQNEVPRRGAGWSVTVPDQSAAWRTRNIGYLLYSSSGLFVREKLRTVHARGFDAVTEVHMALIQNLDLHGTRLTTIAARAGMTKQSMLELVDKAEAMGFVERRIDLDDRRAKIVGFTPSGLGMLEIVHQGVALAERRMAKVIGRVFLSAIKDQLGAYVEASSPEAPLRMSDKNDPWRMLSVNRVLVQASAAFVRDVLRVVHEAGFDTVAEVHQALFRNLDFGGTRLTEMAARADDEAGHGGAGRQGRGTGLCRTAARPRRSSGQDHRFHPGWISDAGGAAQGDCVG